MHTLEGEVEPQSGAPPDPSGTAQIVVSGLAAHVQSLGQSASLVHERSITWQ
jgi:hypothetical protein